MKYIAFYFPQFHSIEENNRWWGHQFTDWELVQAAQKYAEEQQQPRIPLNNNYYDLTDAEVIAWQTQLAKKYGLGGFNFYHYWFDGKLLLGKPMELFLANPNNDLNFCITWANETWTKQWIGSSEILMEQKHLNDKELWQQHFDYLLPFFKDPRYITIDHKPVFCIYRPELNKHQNQWMNFFNQKARENGFEGIYFIGMKSYDLDREDEVYSSFQAKMLFQPRYLFNKKFFQRKSWVSAIEKKLRRLPEKMQFWIGRLKFKMEKSQKVDYVAFGEALLTLAQQTQDKTYQSIIVDWDNTPRYKNRSKFFVNATPANFEHFLKELSLIEAAKGNEFIFINAWNEWSEGAYLEPDTTYEYQYLDVVKKLSE